MDKTCRQLSLSPAVIAASDVQLQNHMLKQAIRLLLAREQSKTFKQLIQSILSFCAMDVRDELAHVRLAETAIHATGRLDAWVNNAGISAWKPIDEIDEAFF